MEGDDKLCGIVLELLRLLILRLFLLLMLLVVALDMKAVTEYDGKVDV